MIEPERIAIDAETILSIAEAATLSGDIRDALLMHLRAIKVPWAMLAEDEQRDHIDAINRSAETAVRRIAGIVAAAQCPHVVGTVNKFTVKNDIKVEFSVTAIAANVTALGQHGKAEAVLVLFDARDFVGQRAPAPVDPDQPDMLNTKAA